MSWVRIDENAMDHPKIGGLPDGAFRLWVQGLAYCQKYLTDGFVSDVALKGLRAYSPKRRAELMTVGLWEVSEAGIQIHDYLQWNESREHVMRVRELARERIRKLRGKNGNGNGVTSREHKENERRSFSGGVSFLSSALGSNAEGGSGETTSDVPERAGRFVERWGDLFSQHRHGAKFRSKPALDFQEAKLLCETWDDSRLETLAIAFLTTDDKFCRESTSLAQFRAKASWCDARLRERGL